MVFSWKDWLAYREKVDELLSINELDCLSGAYQDYIDYCIDPSGGTDPERPWEVSQPYFPLIEEGIRETTARRTTLMQRIERGEQEPTRQFFWTVVYRGFAATPTLHDEIQMLDKLLRYLNRDLSKSMPHWYYAQMNRLTYIVNQINNH